MSETGVGIPTPTYTSFLSQTLREIYLIALYGSPLEYYKAVKKFCLFLPKEIKELIKPALDRIDVEVVAVMRNVKGVDKHYTRVHQMNALSRTCRVMVDPLMSKVTDLLDDRGYLEKAGPTPRAKGDGRLKIE